MNPGETMTTTLPDGAALRIERRDPSVSEQLRDVYDVVVAVNQHAFPGQVQPSFASWAAFAVCDDEENLLLVATVDGEVVGAAANDMPTEDNLNLGELWVRVLPAWRRRGIGTALVNALHQATPAARTTLCGYSNHPLGDEDAYRFAERCGYVADSVDLDAELAFPPSPDVLTELDDEERRHGDGYRIETFVGGLPDEHRAAWMHLNGLLLVDAPSGTVELEASDGGAEGYRSRLQRMREANRTVVETAAFTSDGQLVALTEASADPSLPDHPIKQGSTYVHRDHSGHRLGLAVKLANLRRLIAEFPHHRIVKTSTDATNHPMRAVNERLGFVPVQAQSWFVRRR